MESVYHHSSQGREHVGWRIRLQLDWEPAVWHLIEQVGYVRVDDGRVRRIDFVCTGFQPTPPWRGAPVVADALPLAHPHGDE